MKKKTRMLIMMLVMLLAFSITANAEGFTLSKDKMTVNVGDTVTLETSGTDKVPVWTSYNANLVKVNQRGRVTALKKGKTTVKVLAGAESKTCTVTVVGSSIKLNRTAAAIYHGKQSTTSVQLKAAVKGASKNVNWVSSDTSIAAVNEKGLVSPVSAGTAIITAEANGLKASCKVKVLENDIVLDINNLLLSTKGNGSSIKVTPTVVGPKKNVKWTTSNNTVATVSKGKVTGKGQGSAVITAEANGVTASCNVTVKEGLISINEEKITLYTNTAKPETKQLKTNAGRKDIIKWASSDNSIASVNEKGLVTAQGVGTAYITVENNGNVDTCEVNVVNTSMDIAEDEITVKTKGEGRTYTLSGTAVGRKSSVKWKSSDPKIATVSKGKVTGKKEGGVTITATANGVSDTVFVKVIPFDPTIRLNRSEYELYAGKGNTVTLKATVDGASKNVVWRSSDPSVAIVSGKGKVVGICGGTTVISASANGVTAECLVTVKNTEVELSSSRLKMGKGDTKTITADVTGKSQNVKWATTNNKVAAVKNGVITAKNNGEADIKATANGITSVCRVVVSDEVCSHSYDVTVTRDATCSRNGVQTFTCKTCGDNYNVNIPATDNHNYKAITKSEPVCTEEGYALYACQFCGDSYDEKIPATGEHDYKSAIKSEPTCVKEGCMNYVCQTCGDSYDEVIPATGEHDYKSEIKSEPTCVKEGCMNYVCQTCGDSYDEVIPATDEHDYKSEIKSEPTCVKEGCMNYVCQTCGASYDEVIPATDEHTYEWNTLEEASCEEDGVKMLVCSVCGILDGEAVIPAAGHDWSDWSVVKEATETAVGLEARTCGVCGKTEENELPVVAVKPTEPEKDPEDKPTETEEDPGKEPGSEGPISKNPVIEEGKTPVGIRECICGAKMYYYHKHLSLEERAIWDEHRFAHAAKGERTRFTDTEFETVEEPETEKSETEEPESEGPISKNPVIEEGKTPLGIRECICGAKMYYYHKNLSLEERAIWDEHAKAHAAKGERSRFTETDFETPVTTCMMYEDEETVQTGEQIDESVQIEEETQTEQIQAEETQTEEVQAEENQTEEIQAEEVQAEETQTEEVQTEEIQVEEVQAEETQTEESQTEETVQTE